MYYSIFVQYAVGDLSFDSTYHDHFKILKLRKGVDFFSGIHFYRLVFRKRFTKPRICSFRMVALQKQPTKCTKMKTACACACKE